MQRMTACATAPVSRPKGENQTSSGRTACSPAVPPYTLARAMTAITISTMNWNETRTAWIRSLITMPR